MKIGLIGAMDEEIELLKSSMENLQSDRVAQTQIFSGRINDVDVVLLKSGIGKVNAALATTILIERYRPDFVINTGSAGGFDQSLEVGDVVISTEVRHHDVDVTAFDYEYGQVPNMPAAFTADPYLVGVAERAAAKRLGARNVVKGLIATGDSFMADEGRVRFVKSKFPELKAGEMEAAAVAQVCYQFGTPFVIIRSLSDIAGKHADVLFDQFLHTAAKHSAELIISMIEEMKENGGKNER